MDCCPDVSPHPNLRPIRRTTTRAAISKELLESAQAEGAAVLQRLHTEANGLTAEEARARLKQYGPNEIAREKRKSVLMRLISNVKNPLVILLLALGPGVLPDGGPAGND